MEFGLQIWRDFKLCGAIFVSAVLGCACTQSVNAPSHSTSTHADGVTSTSSHWHLQLHVSGGFAGEDYELALDNDGAWLYDDAARGKHERRSLVPEEIAFIGNLVRDLPAENVILQSDHCADCFQYVVTLQRDGVTNEISVDSTTLHNSAVERLVTKLLSMRPITK